MSPLFEGILYEADVFKTLFQRRHEIYGYLTKSKWPERLVIIRHGESVQNVALDLFQDDIMDKLEEQKAIRDSDIDLTDAGCWQGEETGKYFADSEYEFDICFSSPYVRALKTADEITSQLDYDLKIYIDNRLREKEFGRLHGFGKQEIKEMYPEEYSDRKREGKYWYRLPRGENYPDVEARVHGFLDKLVRDYGGKNVLIVTHQVPYKSFMTLFEHLDESEVIKLSETPNCAIQEYVLDTSKVPEGRMELVNYDLTAYDSLDMRRK